MSSEMVEDEVEDAESDGGIMSAEKGAEPCSGRVGSEAHGLGAGLNTVNPSGSPISPHGSRGFTGWPLLLLLLCYTHKLEQKGIFFRIME